MIIAETSGKTRADAPAGAALIGVDWGTTALRAFLIDASGDVLQRRETAAGVSRLAGRAFGDTLSEVIRDWPAGIPVVMCGMVGSRSGWREVPYLDAGEGVALTDLAARLARVEVEGRTALIAPGVRTGPDVPPDVMRGEETQVFGAGLEVGLAVLPGTHSKWVDVMDGRIIGFRTMMTGDLFAAISAHTVLSPVMSEAASEAEAQAGFDAGVATARELSGPGALLSRLFSIRAGVLLERLPAEQAKGFLSGLLIGAEIAQEAEAGRGGATLIGASALVARYARAFDAFGLPCRVAPPDAAAQGLHAVAVAARLVPGVAA